MPAFPSPRLAALLGIDARTLAALRIGLGMVVLADLATRAPDLVAFHADAGLLPRATLARVGHPLHFSLHGLSGGAWFQALMFAVHAAAACALVAGLWTRAAAIVTWALLLSLQARNPAILHAGDAALRVVLFWAMFLPLGERGSIDARRRARAPGTAPDRARDSAVLRGEAVPRRFPHVSVASAAAVLQVCLVYSLGAYQKWDPIWREEGSAVRYALSLDLFVTPFGKALLAHPDLCRFLSFATLYAEAFLPVLAFAPIATGPIRILVVLALWALHAGFGACLELDLFSPTMMVATLVLLPGLFWDRLETAFAGSGSARSARVAPSRVPAPAAAASPARRFLGATSQALAGAFLAYVVLWNFRGAGVPAAARLLPHALDGLGNALRLDQRWDMFAPYPLLDDGWVVIPARLADGSEIDLMAGGAEVSWAKPASVSATFPSGRWRKYLSNLWLDDYAAYRADFGSYLCRTWNAAHEAPRRIDSLRFVFVHEPTEPEGVPSVARPRSIFEFACDP